MMLENVCHGREPIRPKMFLWVRNPTWEERPNTTIIQDTVGSGGTGSASAGGKKKEARQDRGYREK